MKPQLQATVSSRDDIDQASPNQKPRPCTKLSLLLSFFEAFDGLTTLAIEVNHQPTGYQSSFSES